MKNIGKVARLVFTLSALTAIALASGCVSPTPPAPASASTDAGQSYAGNAKATILGFAVSPAHMPDPGDQDISDFFNLSALAGSHVTLITEWKDEMPDSTIQALIDNARARHLAFHLYLSPISLDGGRRTPAIPASAGGTSFTDGKVRAAFKARALDLAALKPDYLGLGTEVNFLADNPAEYAAYVSLVREACQAIKEKYPAQAVT